MKTLKVRNLILGDGQPKICAPIVAATKEDIFAAGEVIRNLPVDLAEWRVDWFEDAFDSDQVREVLTGLRTILKDIPILFTFRTSKEGGNQSAQTEEYAELMKGAAATGLIDLIDIEASAGDHFVKSLIPQFHKKNIRVILSSHDFEKTPSKEEIISSLCKMQDLGADIPKIAVMPACYKDVLTLLEATAEMNEKYAKGPIITMSMSKLGSISRISGEYFGSSITFGSVGKSSAPGQLEVEALYQILNIIHCN
ncbi:type I 3-dehydroquinate dehydratase [Aminipila terrae]|uniref:3-dehydroquinate dehydratase n=1 Tax=Aminipila terrae TaxID=2697030 RepID=A0A6P1MG83_9FIRM|nr:type I 3-dehydroquinate dehydratase [Aminipila terrae]QHI72193.1 type I 3-dehydroquinate dehydratase [Aminipila terrae]